MILPLHSLGAAGATCCTAALITIQGRSSGIGNDQISANIKTTFRSNRNNLRFENRKVADAGCRVTGRHRIRCQNVWGYFRLEYSKLKIINVWTFCSFVVFVVVHVDGLEEHLYSNYISVCLKIGYDSLEQSSTFTTVLWPRLIFLNQLRKRPSPWSAFYFEGVVVSLPICLHSNQSSLTQQRGERRIGGSI